ncbi:MAG: DUF885 domain-containing protein [Bryobacteraceae bacterium]
MMRRLALATILLLTSLPGAPTWVERSNEHARILLDISARYEPESASRTGIEGVDEKISDISTTARLKRHEETKAAAAELRRRLAAEQDPTVRQDLTILIKAAEDELHQQEVGEKYLLPAPNVAQLVFGGLRTLLDDQVAEKRRPAALVRLRRYAGEEKGYTPIAQVAEQRVRERLSNEALLGPFRAQVEQSLANAPSFLDGIASLFDKYKIEGYREPLAKLRAQVTAHSDFVRKEILPRARADFRLPPELYAIALKDYGVDIAPAELAARAHRGFDAMQREAQELAAQVAREKGWDLTGYRAVVRRLKQDQITGEAIVPHYRQRLGQIEEIVRRENLVTLPGRPARIRLASPAESVANPAPHMRPPRLLGNTGEAGEFVLPLNNPNAAGKSDAYDDFTFAAASWTIAAHELRPGHEMQFASMVEKGVSTARAIFAFNSTNAEGWGLYTEAIMQPHMPPEGRLVSILYRMLRAARAFLDPELQMGKITPEQARRVLTEDVVCSEAMARQEVERYTFRAPGQATSYFYGYLRLMELRAEVEKALGPRFHARKFHDFVLAQGLLPPDLMRKAALDEFVTPAGARATRLPF